MYHDVILTVEAYDDLGHYDERTRKLLIGDLQRLRRARRDETPKLDLKEPEKPSRFSFRLLDDYAAYFHESGAPRTVAIVEWIGRLKDLTDWLERQAERARVRDQRIRQAEGS